MSNYLISGIVGICLCAVVQAAPVGLYTFENNANDVSGNANHGTITGTLTYDTGVSGKALSNDVSATDYVDLPLDIRPGVAPLVTVGCWVDADVLDGNDVIFSTDNGGYDRSLSVDNRGSGYNSYAGFVGSGVQAGKPAAVADGYIFVAGVWNQAEGTFRLYTDGTVSSTDNKVHTDSQSYMRMGSLPNNNESIDGSIDNMFVINTALTDRELYQIYTGGVSVVQNKVPAGELWKIDFEGDTVAITCSGIGTGDSWNSCSKPNWGIITANPSWLNINDSTGAGSTVDFTVTGSISMFSGVTAAYNPVCSDYMFWNVPGTSATITWELTGLTAGATYELTALGGIGPGRDFNLRVDTDADGSLADETTEYVNDANSDATRPARGSTPIIAVADGTGKIIGDADSIGAAEANWGGLIIRKMDTDWISDNATVTYAGTQEGLGEGWRSTGVTKTMDKDSDEVYGTQGYTFFNLYAGGGGGTDQSFRSSLQENLPSYILATVTPGYGCISRNFNGWIDIDNPTLPTGTTVANWSPGIGGKAGASIAEQTIFSYQLGQNIPSSGFRMGFYTDYAGGAAAQTPNLLKVRVGDSEAQITPNPTSTDLDGDMYFFDITGAQPGDVIEVRASTDGAGLFAAVSGVTFDNAPQATRSSTIVNVNLGTDESTINSAWVQYSSYTSVDYDGDGFADWWNNFGKDTTGFVDNGVKYKGIKDIDGNNTPYNIRQTGVVGYNPNDGIIDASWSNRLGVPDNAMSSILFDSVNSGFDIILSGLVPNKTRVRTDVFAALNVDRDMNISVIGKTTKTHANFDVQSYFDDNTEPQRARMSFTGVTADSNGEIIVRKEAIIDGENEFLSAIRYFIYTAQKGCVFRFN